ncbi:hypothetical protein BSKO_05759 [Bryopsis sp. KO-2023]|nr:hypothetical protein BSKO_05759 [Bryopsis sp. KO-2023]
MTNKNQEAVKVVVRCRPLNSQEIQDGRQRIVEMDSSSGQVQVKNFKGDPDEVARSFTFDQVYDWNAGQKEIFDITVQPIVDAVMDGYNGTIFAYGQTGTGKSHTMEGRDDPPDQKGTIPNTFDYIFNRISKESGKKEFLVRASYLEIYNEEIRDLLAKNSDKKLQLKETVDNGVFVKDLMQFVVKGVSEITSVLQVGKKNRAVGSTLMNQDSSRSHSIFTITIETREKMQQNGNGSSGNGKEADAPTQAKDGESHIRVGKLNLVDLAGSERQSKTGATGDRLKEGIKINLSLTALGNVISALVGKSDHIPYRDSKLTRLLQDSLGGNTKTVMIANVGPADWNFDETLSTLRYANRAKNIQNKPRINEDPKDAMLREFQEEIARLKAQLDGKGKVQEKIVEKVVETEVSQEKVEKIREEMRRELEAKLNQSLSDEAIANAKKEAEEKAKAQLEAIMKEKDATNQEKLRAQEALLKQQEEIEQYAETVENQKKEQSELETRIKAMESKVLHGGVNLFTKVDELTKATAETKEELQIRKRQEEEQKRRLAELKDMHDDFEQKYNSLEEEVAAKTSKCKSLYGTYQNKKAELKDLDLHFQAEREDLLNDVRELTQQLKLKDLSIACSIPPKYQEKIMAHCKYSEYDGSWQIEHVQFAGNSIRAQNEASHAQETVDGDLDSGLLHGDSGALANVYFSYETLVEELGMMGERGDRPESRNRPKSGRPGSRKSSARRSSSRNATDIGSLTDAPKPKSPGKQKAELFPQARGLVQSADRRRSRN